MSVKIEKLDSFYASEILQIYKDELETSFLVGTVYQSSKLNCYLKFILDNNLEVFFGALQDGNLTGVVQVRKLNDFYHINNIVVKSTCQGKGIGKILMSYVFDLASLEGLGVSLDVDSNNSKALKMYRLMGFKVQYETIFFIFSFKSENPKKLTFIDNENNRLFGFSNITIDGIEEVEFYWTDQETFRVKSSERLSAIFLEKFNNYINGLLIIDSNLLPSDCIYKPLYKNIVYRMEKYFV